MKSMKDYEFWFVVGSQFLYGPEVLETVAARAQEMADAFNSSGKLPCKVVYKVTVKTPEEATETIKAANFDDKCAGVITWCHTFSPSKMWLNALKLLQKPWCHLATQYNRSIPDKGIDMDFMNLNQAAHGDREHGFIGARLRMTRKVIAGHWQDADVRTRLASWMRVAVGAAFSKTLKVMRFGDNMRNVAVTEGDKVGVQEVLGWQVNTWPVGKLAEYIAAVTDAEADALDVLPIRGQIVHRCPALALVIVVEPGANGAEHHGDSQQDEQGNFQIDAEACFHKKEPVLVRFL